MWLAIAGVVLLIVGVVLMFIRRAQQSKLFEISTTATSTVQELAKAADYVAERLGEKGSFRQVAEVKGRVRCDSPLTSEIAGQPCVYYAMSVTREYEERYWDTDPQTKRRVQRTRRASETVASNSQRVPFWLEDSTGRIQIIPDGAEMDVAQVVDRFEQGGRDGGQTITFGGFTIDVGGFLSGSRTLGYRFRESLLPVDRQVYLLGEAGDSTGELAIQRPQEKGKKFLVSMKSEEELTRSLGSSVRWLLVGAIASGVIGVGLMVAELFV